MMQSRIRGSLWVLGGILLVLVGAFCVVHTECRRVQRAITVVEEAAATPETLPAAIAALDDQWTHSNRRLRFVLPNQSLAEIQAIVVRLQPLAAADSDELQAELATLRALVRWIWQAFSGIAPLSG